MTIISTTVSKNPRRNRIAIIVNKSPKWDTWMQSQKRQNDLCSFPRQTIQYHSNPSLCPDHECRRSWSWTVLWRPIKPSRTDTPKYFLSYYRRLECKSRKSRDIWSNRPIWLWSTKLSRAKANNVLPRELTGHSKHPLPTTQEKTLYKDITRWSRPKSDWLHSLQPRLEKLYRVSKNKTGSWLWIIMNFLLPNSNLNLRK